MTIAVGSFTSAAGSAHPAIPLRRHPADSRLAACRIILIRDSGGDGVSLIHVGADHDTLDRIARHRDGAVGDDEDFEGNAFERMALGDAINLLLHRAGIGVDLDGDRIRRKRGIHALSTNRFSLGFSKSSNPSQQLVEN
jgi:hypothetical protein